MRLNEQPPFPEVQSSPQSTRHLNSASATNLMKWHGVIYIDTTFIKYFLTKISPQNTLIIQNTECDFTAQH